MSNPSTEKQLKPILNKPTTATPVTAPQTSPKPALTSNTPAESINIDSGINLIPTLSKAEVVKEEKKKKLNVSSIVSLLILVVVSILIVGFNIISKMELNAEKETLQTLETSVMNYSQTMLSSNEISSRALLYEQMEGQSYSPKQVLDYINAIATKSGSSYITKFSLGDDLSFTIEGKASDLEDISKFWYLLSNDSKVAEISLKTVGNTTNSANFTFDGKLVLNDFLNSTN